MKTPVQAIELDGDGLSVRDLAAVARDPRRQVTCSAAGRAAVVAARDLVVRVRDEYARAYERTGNPALDYGITTGFGEFKNIPVRPEDVDRHAKNLILSHAAGVGENTDPDDPANYYPADVVRAALVLRVNTFLKGHSGVRLELVDTLLAMLNEGIVPLVPLRGSVGSSGDLCPLAHLFLPLTAEGRAASRFYRVRSTAEVVRIPREWRPASELDPILPLLTPDISVKEGLALTNGATFTAAMLALAVHDGEQLANTADVGLALSLEGARGAVRAFDPKVHAARRQHGQQAVAAHVRALVDGSSLVETFQDVQDPYSLRCAPAVHGATRDALAYAKTIVTREINAATDNPLFFVGGEPWDARFDANWPSRYDAHWSRVEGYDGRRRQAYSAGNFHGQPLGIACDLLAIGLAELANISERRTQMLLDQHHNRGLPPNLVAEPGLNSGLMIAQYSAAGLVSENKVLAHPASVDSIPTSANSEDHNAMSTIAAVKLRRVIANVRFTLAVELLVGAQAVEWVTLLRDSAAAAPPARGTAVTGGTGKERGERARLRGEEQARRYEGWVSDSGRIAGALGGGTAAAYRAIRTAAAPVVRDVVLAPLIREVAALIGPEAHAAGVSLTQQVDAALPPDRRLAAVPEMTFDSP